MTVISYSTNNTEVALCAEIHTELKLASFAGFAPSQGRCVVVLGKKAAHITAPLSTQGV